MKGYTTTGVCLHELFFISQGGKAMTVNGQCKGWKEGMTVADLLEREHYRPERVAVERNGQIVRRGDFAETVLKEADVLEVVSFVGGG